MPTEGCYIDARFLSARTQAVHGHWRTFTDLYHAMVGATVDVTARGTHLALALPYHTIRAHVHAAVHETRSIGGIRARAEGQLK